MPPHQPVTMVRCLEKLNRSWQSGADGMLETESLRGLEAAAVEKHEELMFVPSKLRPYALNSKRHQIDQEL